MTVVYLRQVDAGTDNACWVVCAKGDPGAVAFVPRQRKSRRWSHRRNKGEAEQ